MVALTVPLPRVSFAFASMTALRACSSFSTYRPVPLKVSATGPSLTFTVPVNVSPSVPVSFAPGMHGATFSGFSKAVHTSSTGAGTDRV